MVLQASPQVCTQLSFVEKMSRSLDARLLHTFQTAIDQGNRLRRHACWRTRASACSLAHIKMCFAGVIFLCVVAYLLHTSQSDTERVGMRVGMPDLMHAASKPRCVHQHAQSQSDIFFVFADLLYTFQSAIDEGKRGGKRVSTHESMHTASPLVCESKDVFGSDCGVERPCDSVLVVRCKFTASLTKLADVSGDMICVQVNVISINDGVMNAREDENNVQDDFASATDIMTCETRNNHKGLLIAKGKNATELRNGDTARIVVNSLVDICVSGANGANMGRTGNDSIDALQDASGHMDQLAMAAENVGEERARDVLPMEADASDHMDVFAAQEGNAGEVGHRKVMPAVVNSDTFATKAGCAEEKKDGYFVPDTKEMPGYIDVLAMNSSGQGIAHRKEQKGLTPDIGDSFDQFEAFAAKEEIVGDCTDNAEYLTGMDDLYAELFADESVQPSAGLAEGQTKTRLMFGNGLQRSDVFAQESLKPKVPKQLYNVVREAVRDFNMIGEGERVLVGLSGGKVRFGVRVCACACAYVRARVYWSDGDLEKFTRVRCVYLYDSVHLRACVRTKVRSCTRVHTFRVCIPIFRQQTQRRYKHIHKLLSRHMPALFHVHEASASAIHHTLSSI